MSQSEQVCIQCNQLSLQLSSGLCDSCSAVDGNPIAPNSNNADETIEPNSISRPVAGFASDQFADYEIIEEIARGGMGVVYKARHRKLNRITALKMIISGRFSSAEELQRFQIEAESAATLDHPSIVPIYEIGESEGQAYFAMKYLEGGSLAERIGEFRSEPQASIGMLVKVANAVHHAHQRGILHRDLKPANILLDDDLHPMVTDLGLAKRTSGDSDITHTGAVLGTPSYMPPEQASGDAVTTGVDIYAIGAIMYELLVGRPPYQGNTSIEVVMQVLEAPPTAPHKVDSSVDRDLELICMKCLERNPEDRYASASALAQDLQSWLHGDSISVKPPSIKAVAARWMKRNPRLVYLGFALAMGLFICAPMVFNFLSDDIRAAYDDFPNDRPWFFSIKAPPLISFVSIVILFCVIWPLIGYLNASLLKPKCFLSALKSGIATSIVLSAMFYFLTGSVLFVQGSVGATGDNIAILSKSIWPPTSESDDAVPEHVAAKADSNSVVDSAANRLENANQLFGGVEHIPIGRRAEAVTRRITADMYASIRNTFFDTVLISLLFSAPIVYGTLIAWIIIGRNQQQWIAILRYSFVWFSLGLFVLILYVLWRTRESDLVTKTPYAAMIMTGSFLTPLIVSWLGLRRWKPVAVSKKLEPVDSLKDTGEHICV